MVSLYVTSFGYLIARKSAEEVYECLSAAKYLRPGADRQSVLTLIKRAQQKPLSFGDEYWRVVQNDLRDAKLLSAKGVAATSRYVTRRGQKVASWWQFWKRNE
jgi:hypothetical protein